MKPIELRNEKKILKIRKKIVKEITEHEKRLAKLNKALLKEMEIKSKS
jgi:hypothetical protein